MHLNSKIFIVIAFIFIIIFVGCGEGEKDLKSPGNLKPLFSFGHKGDVILGAPLFMITDGHNSIFISDQYFNKIYEFSLEGAFQREVGREGRGPGEYVNPLTLATDGEWLYVQDTGNMRLVLFSLDDDSSEIINLDRSFIEFKVNQDKIYGFAPGNLMAPVLDENLITVYNTEGNRINSFGNYLTMVEELPAGISWPYVEVEDGIIYIVFQYFPIYRAYGTDGELLAEQDLSEAPVSIEKLEQNYEESTYNSNYGFRQEMTVAFRAIDMHENRMFVSRQAMTIVIDEYLINEDNSLTYQTTYFYNNLPEHNVVQKFFYHEESNSFYILEANEVPKVTVYQVVEDD